MPTLMPVCVRRPQSLAYARGLSGLKLDRGDEDTPSNPTDVYFDGRSGAEMRNAYPVLSARVHSDVVRRVRGNDFLVYPQAW